MRKLNLFALAGLITAILMVACTPAAATPTEEPPTEEAEAAEEGRAFVVADISDDPSEVIEGMQPFADYLAEHLSEYGITHGEVVVARDDAEMARLLESGEVDLYFDSLYPAMLISDESGAMPILRRWRRGVGEYHTVIFTKSGGDIETIEDLNGKIIALDNQFSTSGFVLPAVYLTEQGLTLTGLESYEQSVSEDEVGFVFSFDDQNSVQWVLNGLVAAGATDNVTFERFPEESRAELTILAETDSVPRQVVLAQPNMDADLLAAVKELLITMHEDEEGMAALEVFDGTAKFDDFPEGIDAALANMRELKEIIAGIELP